MADHKRKAEDTLGKKKRPTPEEAAVVDAIVESGVFVDRRPSGFLHIRDDGTTARLCASPMLNDARFQVFGPDHGVLVWEEDMMRERKFCAWLDEDNYAEDNASTVCSDVLEKLGIRFAGTVTSVLLARANGEAFSAHDLDKLERLCAYWKRVEDLNAVYNAYEEDPEDAPYMSEPELSSFDGCEDSEEDE